MNENPNSKTLNPALWESAEELFDAEYASERERLNRLLGWNDGSPLGMTKSIGAFAYRRTASWLVQGNAGGFAPFEIQVRPTEKDEDGLKEDYCETGIWVRLVGDGTWRELRLLPVEGGDEDESPRATWLSWLALCQKAFQSSLQARRG